MSARLKLVPPPPEPAPETPTQRIRRLQAEAHQIARQQVDGLNTALLEVAGLAEEIAEGGDAYPVGARELARRLVEEMSSKAQTLQAILLKA